MMCKSSIDWTVIPECAQSITPSTRRPTAFQSIQVGPGCCIPRQSRQRKALEATRVSIERTVFTETSGL